MAPGVTSWYQARSRIGRWPSRTRDSEIFSGRERPWRLKGVGGLSALRGGPTRGDLTDALTCSLGRWI